MMHICRSHGRGMHMARTTATVENIARLAAAVATVAAAAIPFPPQPASLLPSIDGTFFPEYRTVFVKGECTLNDRPEGALGPSPYGPTAINTNKTCFSCFRIPTLLAGQTPGVIHGTFLWTLPVHLN